MAGVKKQLEKKAQTAIRASGLHEDDEIVKGGEGKKGEKGSAPVDGHQGAAWEDA